MYFFSIDSLKSDLAHGELNQSEDMKYVVATLILYTLGTMPVEAPNTLDYLSSFIGAVIVLIGSLFCYWSNGGRTGEDFLRKYLSISWVVGVRLGLAVLFLLFLVSIFIGAMSVNISYQTTPIDLTLMTLLSVFYFWRVNVHIKELKAFTSSYNASPSQ